MTSASFILIAAVLLLGGLIAALGDTLGSKVGKARLRLFNLRPRRTATIVTVTTGFSIAAFTLGVLFAFSKSLRQGLFELESILNKLNETRVTLDRTYQEKLTVESELQEAKIQKKQTEENLARVDRKYQTAISQLKNVSSQANDLRADVRALLAEKEQLSQQRENLKQQISQLKQEIARQKQLSIAREEKITAQDRIIKEKEGLLVTLEGQQKKLQAEIERRDRILQRGAARSKKLQERLKQLEGRLVFVQEELEQYYQNYLGLRAKTIALLRGQVLAFATITIGEDRNSNTAIDRLLQQANLRAIQAINPSKLEERQTIKITKTEVENIIKQIKDGREYVVRILSAGNYVEGEQEIRVVADVVINRKIFKAEQPIASIPVDSNNTSPEQIRQTIDLLLSTARLRARRSGILGKVEVEDGNFAVLFNFFEELKNSDVTPTSIRAIAIADTYAAGPLKLRLIALHNGEILFTT